jgi:four helix bundle protein
MSHHKNDVPPWLRLADVPTTTESQSSDDADKARHAAGTFPHEKLDAYHVALAMAALARYIAERIPRGHRNVADHMMRAAENTVLLLAEGANRRGAALKRQRFGESRGECGEVAAAAGLLQALEIGGQSEVAELRHFASRVSAMLTRLMARLA